MHPGGENADLRVPPPAFTIDAWQVVQLWNLERADAYGLVRIDDLLIVLALLLKQSLGHSPSILRGLLVRVPFAG